MKKFYLVSLLVMVVCMGVYADSPEDALFKQLVELTRNNKENPAGMTVAADYTYRILYFATPIEALLPGRPINSSEMTPEALKTLKSSVMKGIAQDKSNVETIKKIKVNYVFTIITSDKRISTFSFSYKDL